MVTGTMRRMVVTLSCEGGRRGGGGRGREERSREERRREERREGMGGRGRG